jgi:hypothetical protein
LAENKSRVQEALEEIILCEVGFPTTKFELEYTTVGNYSRLVVVKIYCVVDNKRMQLLLRMGSLESNMHEHVIGISHHENPIITTSILYM